jgi:hypothetical protein
MNCTNVGTGMFIRQGIGCKIGLEVRDIIANENMDAAGHN